jgi:hypothetical protein
MRIIHGNSNSSNLALLQRSVPKFRLKELSISCRFNRSSGGLHACADEAADRYGVAAGAGSRCDSLSE